MGKETSKRRIWIAIGIVVLILVVLIFFSDIQKVVNVLLDADWVVLGVAALCMLCGMLLITTRWRYFLDNRPRLTKFLARLPNMNKEGLQGAMANIQTGLSQVQSTRKLVIIPPSSPPMIGVYQGIMVAILLPFGILNLSQATACAMLVFIVMLVLWFVLAVWGLRKENLRVSDVIHESRSGVNVGAAPAVDPS